MYVTQSFPLFSMPRVRPRLVSNSSQRLRAVSSSTCQYNNRLQQFENERENNEGEFAKLMESMQDPMFKELVAKMGDIMEADVKRVRHRTLDVALRGPTALRSLCAAHFRTNLGRITS